MLHVHEKRPAATAAAPACPAPVQRRPRSPMRSRVMFLRHYQNCGVVLRAAELAGLGRSTLYRWRDQDARFRARWESIAEQRRQQLEDTLIQISTDGERMPVFHKGVQVGWQQKNRLQATIALLAYLDRREKRQLAEQEKVERRDSVSHAGVSHARVSPPTPAALPSARMAAPVFHADTRSPAQKPVPVSRSGARVAAEKPVPSKPWGSRGARRKPVLPVIPHRLHDDWMLPPAARRPAVPPGPFRPVARPSVALAVSC